MVNCAFVGYVKIYIYIINKNPFCCVVLKVETDITGFQPLYLRDGAPPPYTLDKGTAVLCSWSKVMQI